MPSRTQARTVDSGEIIIRAVAEGDQAVICVSDNGCGVPQENLSKLYDPFFTTKEVGRGTGQGLAISHSIVVDKHGGEISVSSEVGVGTQFTVRLPIAGRARTSGLMKDILFVDDERELLDSLRARLYKHRHDWNMRFVSSGDEAIAALEQQKYDLVVSDVRMPGMDGGQLLTVVKQRWPERDAHHRLGLFGSRASGAADLPRASIRRQALRRPRIGKHHRTLFLSAGIARPGAAAQGGRQHRQTAGDAENLWLIAGRPRAAHA